jgi:hypothetical protein
MLLRKKHLCVPIREEELLIAVAMPGFADSVGWEPWNKHYREDGTDKELWDTMPWVQQLCYVWGASSGVFASLLLLHEMDKYATSIGKSLSCNDAVKVLLHVDGTLRNGQNNEQAIQFITEYLDDHPEETAHSAYFEALKVLIE